MFSGPSKTFQSVNHLNPENTLLDHPLEIQAEMNLLPVNRGGGLKVGRPGFADLTYGSQLIDIPGPHFGPP